MVLQLRRIRKLCHVKKVHVIKQKVFFCLSNSACKYRITTVHEDRYLNFNSIKKTMLVLSSLFCGLFFFFLHLHVLTIKVPVCSCSLSVMCVAIAGG